MSGSPTPVPTPDSTASVTICHDISSPAAREGSRRPDAEPKRHPIYALWSAGFAGEIIPVVPGEKVPKIEGWQAATITLDQLEAWIAGGYSFGLRTRTFPCLDVDVTDPKVNAAIEAAIEDVFGQLPKRTGQAPKFAIPFRALEQFTKMTIALRSARGDDAGKIEVLADGQQYVVHGPHPKTKRPYAWSHAGTEGGVELLA